MSDNGEDVPEMPIDPRLLEELEDANSEEDIIGSYHTEGGEEARVPLVEKFSPDGKEWGGKSIFKQGQPRYLTLADNLAEAFPVLKPSEDFIEQFIEDYEMRLTSVDGVSRDQLQRIFQSMFSGKIQGDGERPNALEIALSAGPEDND